MQVGLVNTSGPGTAVRDPCSAHETWFTSGTGSHLQSKPQEPKQHEWIGEDYVHLPTHAPNLETFKALQVRKYTLCRQDLITEKQFPSNRS